MTNNMIAGDYLVGWLMHDNKLFDSICPECGRMESSFGRSTCVKCGALLVPLTGRTGKAYSVSEGTISPAWGEEQLAKNERAIKARGGMRITYRFKIYNFAEDGEMAVPHELHWLCKKGAKVELCIKNHTIVPKAFQTRPDKDSGEREWKLEFMYHILEDESDTTDYIKVLKAAQFSDKTVSHPTNANGSPAPINVEDDPAALRKQLEELRAEKAALEAAIRTSSVDDSVDPLANAKGEPAQEPAYYTAEDGIIF
jgi:hypothetical protein